MINLKYARLFNIKDQISLSALLNAGQQSPLEDLQPNIMKSYGWSTISPPAILESPSGQPYLISRFEGFIRSAPKELVERHIAFEKKRLEALGEPATKEYLKTLAGDLTVKIGGELAPEHLEGHVIFLTSGLIIVSAKKRSMLDLLSHGLQFVLEKHNIFIRPHFLAVSRHKLRLLAMNHTTIGASILELAGKQGKTTTKIDPNSVAPAFYRQALINTDIDRVTFYRDDMLYVCITSKATINSIKPGEKFDELWREYGNAEESELLDNIRAGIWIDELTGLISTIEMDGKRLTSVHGDITENEEEVENRLRRD